MRGSPNPGVITFHTQRPMQAVHGAYHLKEGDQSIARTQRRSGKEYLPLNLTGKQVLQYKYHYPKGDVKQNSMRLGNTHDGHIPCNPSYAGHIPGYSINDDCGKTRGAVVRSISARQRAPVPHGEPVGFPGQRTRPEVAVTVLPEPKTAGAAAYLQSTSALPALRGVFSPRTEALPSMPLTTVTRQTPNEIFRATKQVYEPTGSKWLYEMHMQDRPTELGWGNLRPGQAIASSFTTARSYAGCGRC